GFEGMYWRFFGQHYYLSIGGGISDLLSGGAEIFDEWWGKTEAPFNLPRIFLPQNQTLPENILTILFSVSVHQISPHLLITEKREEEKERRDPVCAPMRHNMCAGAS